MTKCRSKNPAYCKFHGTSKTVATEIYHKMLTDNKHLGEIKTRTRLAAEFEEQPDIKTLTALANDVEKIVRIELAENHSTPAEILTILALTDDHQIQYFIAQNPNTPEAVLKEYLQSSNNDVVYMAARNPNLTVNVLENLIMSVKPGDDILYFTVQNPNISATMLEKVYAAKENHKIVGSIVAHKNCPSSLMWNVVETKNLNTYTGIAENVNASPELLNIIANEHLYNVLKHYGDEGEISVEDFDKNVKSLVALNRNTAEETLLHLSNPENSMSVLECVAFNPKTPSHILSKLSNENRNLLPLHAALASNPNTPAEVLNHIKEKPHWMTTKMLASNPALTENDLLGFLIHSDKEVRSEAYYNPSVDKDIRIAAILAGGVHKTYANEELYQASKKDDKSEYYLLLQENQQYNFWNDF